MVVRKARRQRSNEPGRDISEIHNPFLLIPIQPYTKVL